MEVQLQELIDKIKKDGIESASEEAVRIKRAAEADAARIISAAQKEAEDRLIMMLKDRSILTAMGKRNREIIEQNYTLEQMGAGYKQIYLSFYSRSADTL